MSETVPGAPGSVGEPQENGSSGFFDDFRAFDSRRWSRSDGWHNGGIFDCGWRADHVTFGGSVMTLQLDDVGCPHGCSGRPFSSGEFWTNAFYGYGHFEVRMKPARAPGIVSSFFVYTDPSDGNPWDEIDIEFPGKDATRLQTNYIADGVGGHEMVIDLGFDASADFHTYAFDWSPAAITWYVDGKQVRTETGARGPLPRHAGRIMVNLWPGIGVDGWLEPFVYAKPLAAAYDWIRFRPRSGGPVDVASAVEPHRRAAGRSFEAHSPGRSGQRRGRR